MRRKVSALARAWAKERLRYKRRKSERSDSEHDVPWGPRPDQRFHHRTVDELDAARIGVVLREASVGLPQPLRQHRQEHHHR